MAATLGIERPSVMPTGVTEVVVPVNGYPPNDRALPVAASLADQFGASLTLASMLFDAAHRDGRARMLHRLARSLSPRMAVSTALGQGTDPSAFILDLMHGQGSLVVLAGGTTILGIPGSTTSDVLRFASAPTVLVGPRVQGWHGPVGRVVVPLDGSAPSRQALETAVRWCISTGASCELVSVADPDVAVARPGQADGSRPHAIADARAELEAATTIVRGELRRGGHEREVHSARLLAPAPRRAEAVCAHADDPTTVICMATKGSRHSHAMIAGTTLRVVHLAPVPVLVTRS
jgi:nucleotide-binding universal stress UspA family protein